MKPKSAISLLALLVTILCLASGFGIARLTTVEKFDGVRQTESSLIVYVDLSPSSRSSTVIQSLPGGSYSVFTSPCSNDSSTDTDTSFDVWKCADGLTLVFDVPSDLGCGNVWKTSNPANSPSTSLIRKRM